MHRIIIDTINKMIINIRNEINKSFFFIISSLLSYRKLASTQQLVFPSYDYIKYMFAIQYVLLENSMFNKWLI